MKDKQEINIDDSDQAALVGGLVSLHLQSSGHIDGKPNPECAFCKGFIIDSKPLGDNFPLESYSFQILCN